MSNNFNTPILFVVFNRPDTTRRVFESIKKIKPSQLFIAADGPRENKIGEKEKCEEVRNIFKQIDWQCEVQTLFQEKNLGCKVAVSTAINWFFQNTNEGIILEDDCLPNQSFFIFMSKMLEKYRGNEKIMHISGTNFQFGNKRGTVSYYFSRCVHIWGWATWKRAWETYDVGMKDLDQYSKSNKVYKLFKEKRVADFWISLFNHILKKNVDTWDAQWAYAVIKSEGIAITPNTNLVENIGFGTDATHTGKNTEAIQKSTDIGEIKDPQEIRVDEEADDYLVKRMYIKSLFQKIIDKISNLG